MAGICCGVVGESETSASVKSTPRRRRTEIRQLKIVSDGDVTVPQPENGRKRTNAVKRCAAEAERSFDEIRESSKRVKVLNHEKQSVVMNMSEEAHESVMAEVKRHEPAREYAKFGVTSLCGRRRDMEDAVSIHPSFCGQGPQITSDSHFFGVFDGHGCSHVALKCKAGMHQIVKEELEQERERRGGGESWKEAMERSFSRMDKEVQEWSNTAVVSNCRCELQTPRCDAVGSTAVVSVVTPDKIVVSNCGDSRAVLCRNGVAIPLSSDHKPDRPDELKRIESAGGRVIYWDGARVLGVLAMSRAIGDNYLKPYVISEPEVTITDRTAEDECLILASDGLWDVVSNETACGVARMCLNAQKPSSPPVSPGSDIGPLASAGVMSSDKPCLDASILLTKLALARHSSDNVSVVVVDLRRDL